METELMAPLYCFVTRWLSHASVIHRVFALKEELAITASYSNNDNAVNFQRKFYSETGLFRSFASKII
jgi:hypothetical protein